MQCIAGKYLRQVLGPQLFLDHVESVLNLLQACATCVVVMRSLLLTSSTYTHFDGGELDTVNDALLRWDQRRSQTKNITECGAPVVLSDERMQVTENTGIVVLVRLLRITALLLSNGNALTPDIGVGVLAYIE